PNAEMATVKPKKESTFQKVENQTVDLVGGKRKSMFDWLDDWSNLGGVPNKEIAETAKIKGKEKADLTAAAQKEKPYKPQDVFVSKDSVRIVEPLTERQQLQADLLKLYGEKGAQRC
ncbi:MAG: hypothetical protein IJW74_00565, partial [Oscillospiraceae bacterium]|nr:hypothetical protein [Oscillospiraceae bacterium]